MRLSIGAVTLFLCLGASVCVAQVPTFSLSDFTCSELEDDSGCYGGIFYEDYEINLRRCRILALRLLRGAKRDKRIALRAGDDSGFSTAQARISAAKAARRSECRSCWNSASISRSCDIIANPGGVGTFSTDRVYSRIANGAQCSSVSASPVVALTDRGEAFCTGTLIAANTVLTAAHCFAGTSSVNGLAVALSDGTSISMASFVQNPNWPGGSSNVSDSAIVKLSGSFSGVNIAEICWGCSFSVGDFVVMAGYGVSEVNSTGILRATINTIESFDNTRIETRYNVGDNEGSTCVGDSGGALWLYETSSGKWKIIGDLSTGGPSECAVNGAATFDESQWTNLNQGNHRSFIEANL
ncbi:MAG: S1 family peptidase [Bdellovibrionales bacterium]|nr:S1 family peptidase [Bdellovibrionales bacterium]